MSEDNEVVERVERYVTLQYDEDRPTVADLRALLALARQSSGVGEEEIREAVGNLRSHGTALYPSDHSTAKLLWNTATLLERLAQKEITP